MRYLERCVDIEIDQLLREAGALSIEGAKGVGKTATAERRAKTTYMLDSSFQREILANQPDLITTAAKPVLIDEWQRLPEIWDVTRRSIDRDASPNQYILTGSAAPTTGSTHSGAGRILTVRMRPLSFAERKVSIPTVSISSLLKGNQPSLDGHTEANLTLYVKEICASGFPGIRHYTEEIRGQFIDSYIQRIVDHDFKEMGHTVRKPATLKRWLAAYAAATSTNASYEKIRDAATSGQGDKPGKETTVSYRDVLERMWILEPLDAWVPTHNHISQLSTPPKHHLVDPALAAQLLGVTVESLLRPDPTNSRALGDTSLLGALFESLVTQSLRVYSQPHRVMVQHFRTQGGEREVDLILVRPDGRIIAVEVKLNSVVTDADVKHLMWLRRKLGDEMMDAIVINAGPYAYRRKDGIGVVPLALLGP